MCGYIPGVYEPEDEQHETQTLLAIDTSIGTSVALVTAGTTYSASNDDERGHTEVIGTLIAQVFAEANVSSRSVTGVVAGIGPGPFTGLRIGIAAAKAFAAGLGAPLLPLSGHDAVAFEALTSANSGVDGNQLRVLQDARRRELFVSVYSGLDSNGLPVRVAEASLLARADYAEQQGDVWPSAVPAASLLRLAELRLKHGIGFAAPGALYLRAPDAKPAGAVKRVSV